MNQLPSQCLAVIGHEDAKRQIEAAYDGGRMHHAWLLVGPEGVGKASLAFHAAHMILSKGENRFSRFNPQHPAARLIMAESHPDLFVLRREADEKTGAIKETISVEQARGLAPFLRLTASHGGGRVAIIDEAHRLNRNGQNAILKMVEEPPEGATIFLTATTAGSLLPTIRSRCRLLPLAPLSAPEMETVFARLGVDLPKGQEKERLLELANGSVGAALRILETESLPLLDEVFSILSGLPTLETARLHKLADLMAKKADSERFKVVSGLLTETLRRAARAAAEGKRDPLGLAARLDKPLQVWENTARAFAAAEGAYLDNKAAFISVMTNIARAAG